jgi:hypothetical protein
MTKKPDFLIVGAAKAGTTSLYYYLQQHPDIWFPKLKETKYFSSKIKPYPQNGIGDWSIDRAAITKSSDYYNLFKSCPDDMIKGEASPDYLLFSKDLAPIIKEELGDIPIIISIRNPIYRAFSAYSNLLRDNREVLNFKSALDSEDERINQNWDFMWHYKKSGFYTKQINDFKKHFSNVNVILFDDLIKSPETTCRDIFNFLGLNEYSILCDTAHNPSGIPNSWFVKMILNRQSKAFTYLREVLKTFIPRRILENIAKSNMKKIKISRADFNYLNNYYSNEVDSLEKMLNKDLSDWRKWKK